MRTLTRSLLHLITLLFVVATAHTLATVAGLSPAFSDPADLVGPGLLVGTISVQDPVLAWRRIANYMHSFSPDSQAILKALKSYLVQHGSNPDLEVVPFDELSDTDVVIADAASKLFAIVLKKDTTTATFTKATNHASASSDTAADIVIKSATVGEHVLVYPRGEAFATGITMQGNTTADAGTGSGTNGCKGFAIIGAA
jgi:hypothetical protein